MPATYEKIATTTLGSANATIQFSSIPSTYTDLRIVFVCTPQTSGGTKYLQFNSSATGYSQTYLQGNGSAASSGRSTSYPRLDLSSQDSANSTPSFDEVDIFSYAGSTFKTVLSKTSHDQNGSGLTVAQVGLWQSTSAITQINLYIAGDNIGAGSTATIYGILKA
jgi:hypothetical protein